MSLHAVMICLVHDMQFEVPVTPDTMHAACRGAGIALDIAKGIHFLHSHNVMHLDLKSPNILLAQDGTAKIADVGLSRVFTGHSLPVSKVRTVFPQACCHSLSLGLLLVRLINIIHVPQLQRHCFASHMNKVYRWSLCKATARAIVSTQRGVLGLVESMECWEFVERQLQAFQQTSLDSNQTHWLFGP